MDATSRLPSPTLLPVFLYLSFFSFFFFLSHFQSSGVFPAVEMNQSVFSGLSYCVVAFNLRVHLMFNTGT